MCTRGHALIRVWADQSWWLSCVNPGCAYRIFESHPTHPKEAPVSETIEIKYNPEMHTRAPQTEIEKIVWSALDTAFDLVRQASVKVILQSLREESPEFPSDAELFKSSKESGVEGAPTGYLDLAPVLREAAEALNTAFELTASAVAEEALEGLGLSVNPKGDHA